MNEFMQNREISWLRFNERVLEEAAMDEVPLLEKLKFISIFCSNLDEFFMVRVGSLHDLSLLKKEVLDNKTGMNAKEQIKAVVKILPPMMDKRDTLYNNVIHDLEQYGIFQLKYENLSEEQKKFTETFYLQQMRELLTPQIVDLNHPFPFLENKKLYVLVQLEKDNRQLMGLLPVSSALPPYLILPGDRFDYILMEELILHFIEKIFDGFHVQEKKIFTVTRNFDLTDHKERCDEFDDYREYMKSILKKRKRLNIVRLESYGKLSKDMLTYLTTKLGIDKSHYFTSLTPLKMDCVFDFINDVPSSIREELLYRPFRPYNVADEGGSMIEKIRKDPYLLLYPFDDVSAFLTLLREASEDPDCVSIKITIYRLAKHSEIVKLLCRAAENGVEVTVLMELKARFDEESNIHYSHILYEAGCNIIYGFPEYKTHSKLCLITFQDDNYNANYITQVGTGNYNESTSRQYTDFSLFTSNRQIALDAYDFFNHMAMGNLNGKYGHLLQSPSSLKQHFLRLIDEEIAKGPEGYLYFKFNSLTDIDFIKKLQQASCAGVEVKLLIRGICCILPNIPDVTENIEIHSVVGRFLEHTRLYIFGRGEKQKIYISSADLMTRNTERRVEIATPIYDDNLRKKLVHYGEILFSDDVKGRRLKSNGEYEAIPIPPGKMPLSSQDYFIKEALEKNRNLLEGEEITKTHSSTKDTSHHPATLRERIHYLFYGEK